MKNPDSKIETGDNKLNILENYFSSLSCSSTAVESLSIASAGDASVAVPSVTVS
ncbi:MAG: hypothetical protein R2769_02715 [Saprospiraceae bacterium]